MDDFFDTGVIVGASYVRGITYANFDPSLIDPLCHLCNTRFNQAKSSVICTEVVMELRKLNHRRKIMHDIILMELMGADQDLIADQMISLSTLGVVERDIDWVISKTHKLRNLDPEETCMVLEDVKQIFELNIINIISESRRYQPMKKAKRTSDKIFSEITKMPKIPNVSDVRILSDAITFHNFEKEVNFVSVDKAFNDMGYKKIQKVLADKSIVKKYPLIEVLRLRS